MNEEAYDDSAEQNVTITNYKLEQMMDLIDPRVRFQIIDADQAKSQLKRILSNKSNHKDKVPPVQQKVPNITLDYQLGKGGQAKVYKCFIEGIEESVSSPTRG